MLKFGLSVGRTLPRSSLRLYSTVPHTTSTHIVDVYGKVIKLTDPKRPEIGDYPDFEQKLYQNRDPYAKYDDQQNRRNKNDPLSIDDDLYDMWSPDYLQPVSDKTALFHNFIFFSIVFGLGYSVYHFQLNPEKPALPRSYPYNGLAKNLGSANDESDFFYRTNPDKTAEQELGILSEDPAIESAKTSYEQDNSDYIKA